MKTKNGKRLYNHIYAVFGIIFVFIFHVFQEKNNDSKTVFGTIKDKKKK